MSFISSSVHARVDAVIDHALAEQRLIGALVYIMEHGELIYQRAAGDADREAGIPMSANTLFRLASVSKPIVSAAALVLAAQQRLALDDAITRWLPEFQPSLLDGSPAVITTRQLLSHTAGLGYRFFEATENGPYAMAGVSDGMDLPGISLMENLRRLASVPLLYAPGSGWGYSLSIDVLGAVIERVCDQLLDEAVQTLVTGPLGMGDTGFIARDAQRLAAVYVNDQPTPHRMQEKGEVVAPIDGVVGAHLSPARALSRDAYFSGGAGMVGSAEDFLRLLETLRQGGATLLPSAWVDEMSRDQTGGLSLPNASGFGFGLGFSVLRDPSAAESPESAGTWRWGGAYGHSWFVDCAQALSVVAFTNTLYEGMSGRFTTELRDAVYGG